ncbi:MAG: ABC transporter permease subunit [Treponema sp.]|nr:ABC transporter permease subunit [Treponema sp.]
MANKNKTLVLMKRHWQMYLLLLLPLLFIIIFHYYPMLGAQIAFKRFRSSLGIWGSPWIGFTNFVRFFQSYQFIRVVSNTALLSLYGLIAGMPFPIIFALLLNTVTQPKLKKTIQTVTYLPYFISTVVLVGMMFQILDPRIGIWGKFIFAVTGSRAPDLFGKANYFPHLFVWSGIWQNMGWNSIIYLAALSAVSPELHEAGKIDGMNRLMRIIYIDFPAILPTATILLIMNFGRIMTIGFEKAYLMANDLNRSASEVISTYVYRVGLVIGGGDFSYATAIGLFNSVINLILIITVNKVCSRLGGNSLW